MRYPHSIVTNSHLLHENNSRVQGELTSPRTRLRLLLADPIQTGKRNQRKTYEQPVPEHPVKHILRA